MLSAKGSVSDPLHPVKLSISQRPSTADLFDRCCRKFRTAHTRKTG